VNDPTGPSTSTRAGIERQVRTGRALAADPDQQLETAIARRFFRRRGQRIRFAIARVVRAEQHGLAGQIRKRHAAEIQSHDARARRRRANVADREREHEG
jgi:hypothetical protein